jgi:glycosyltransferase involved in cell wall biosynthesis
MKRLRICLIASSRFPVAEPFAGGLEAQTHTLAGALRDRGHEVTLFAAPGSDPALGATALDVAEFEPSDEARSDVGASPEQWMREHHAYLALMLDLARTGHERFDVVHNNSLHHLPVALAPTLSVPMVTTLHTPPTPWLESAVRLTPPAHGPSRFVAVSGDTASRWAGSMPAEVILNGIDTERWRFGPGGTDAVWFGRVVPEKAPHVAIDAARLAGVPLVLAGPVHDHGYFSREIAPRLGDGVHYAGHLASEELIELVRHSSVSIVSPDWPEPYGLVAAESMACGTPVAGVATGALPEIVTAAGGRLAAPGDVPGLADAVLGALELPRRGVRRHAVERCSVETMVDEYERCFIGLLGEARAA